MKKLGEQINNSHVSLTNSYKRHAKKIHRRALRRIPIDEHVPTNRYSGWAD